jgi:hypothetical protein
MSQSLRSGMCRGLVPLNLRRSVLVAQDRAHCVVDCASPAQDAGVVSRREAMFAGLIVTASLATAAPAEAFLGIGEGTIMDQYQSDTVLSISEPHFGLQAYLASRVGRTRS